MENKNLNKEKRGENINMNCMDKKTKKVLAKYE